MTVDAIRSRPFSIILLVALVLVFLQLDLSSNMTFPIGSTDLILFWAAATVLMNGGSPYNNHAYITRLKEVGVAFDQAGPPLFWNPPWILSFIWPFALFSLSVLAKIWMLLSCAIFLFTYRLSKLMSKKAAGRPHSVSSALSITSTILFFPFMLCIWFGQITPISLLSVTLCLNQELKSKKIARDYFLSGLFLSVTFLKPHLVYLLWAHLAGQHLRQRKFFWFLGIFSGIALLNLTPLVIHPSMYVEYVKNMQHAPLYWQCPTLPSFLSWSLHLTSPYLKLLPAVICGTIVTVRSLLKTSTTYDYLLLLIPLSILSSPYGWVYDFVLFMPALVHYSLRSKSLATILIVCNLMMILSPSYSMDTFYWYPPVFSCIGLLNLISSMNSKDLPPTTAAAKC